MTTSVRCTVCHRALEYPYACKIGMGPVCAKRAGVLKPRKLRRIRATPLFNLKEQTLGVPLFDLGEVGA